MGTVSRGFRGRRPSAELPPGQYLVEDFPVLSAGPTPSIDLQDWEYVITSETDQQRRWDWAGFRNTASPSSSTIAVSRRPSTRRPRPRPPPGPAGPGRPAPPPVTAGPPSRTGAAAARSTHPRSTYSPPRRPATPRPNRIQDIAAVFLSIAVVATFAAAPGRRQGWEAPPGCDWPVALATGGCEASPARTRLGGPRAPCE